jgi:ubiquinone/menaquinone biosynthesis C-methylase UbiE
MTSFHDTMTIRSAAVYADFLLPHLARDADVLDLGCGSGSIALGVAETVGRVTAVDRYPEEFVETPTFAADHGVRNIRFLAADAYRLPFDDGRFDACLCHSMLETLDRPLDALREIARTLVPGGILGIACVEYGGLILAGPNEPLLRRFYAVRERLWQLEHVADPYRGRKLRGLLTAAGFEDVVATTKYICYGTDDAVRWFGRGRAEDCRDEWYAGGAQEHDLATADDIDAMERAWIEWAGSPDAYAAFAWGRATGRTPNR